MFTNLGHESIWQWESSLVIANYFSWADDKPTNYSGNRNDCVYMTPKYSHFVWTDHYCDRQVGFQNIKDFKKQMKFKKKKYLLGFFFLLMQYRITFSCKKL